MKALDLTAQLIAIDSQNPGPGERDIAEFVVAWCEERGIPTEVIESVSGRPNVVATVDAGPGSHFGLTGHLDTKTIGDVAAAWLTNPLELTVVDDLAYGLGASDMKGAIAAMMLSLEGFANGGRGGAITLLLTADEEQGSEAGSKALVRSSRLPPIDALVVGEPSGLEESWEGLFLVSRGLCCFEVEIETAQGHSGLSGRLGPNAIMVATDVIRALELFDPPVDEQGWVEAHATVNPAIRIAGGTSFGVWPGRCMLSAELRTVPGMDRTRTQAAVADLVRRAAGPHATVTVRFATGSQGWMPATELDPAHPIVAAANHAARAVLGRDLPHAAYPGGTDASYFMGEAGIPTIASLGPGLLSVAHGPNEYIAVRDLDDAVNLYSALISEYLAAGSRL